MAKKPGELAYDHYLKTGTIAGMSDGAYRRGIGRSPSDPLTFEEFLKVSRNEPLSPNPPSWSNHTNDGWPPYKVVPLLHNNQDITQKACNEGWICGLYDFVRDNRRLPKRRELDDLRHAADRVTNAATGSENLGLMHGGLVKLAQVMLDRRAQMTAEFKR